MVNAFSYPRTGAHFLNYCLTGLFDYIALPHSHLHHKEAIEREAELNPEVLYALKLRESGAAYVPVHFDWLSNGIHGLAAESEREMIVLIRDPIATAYSRYRVQHDRFRDLEEFSGAWLRAELLEYSKFYSHAFTVLEQQGERGLLLRWEDLVAGPQALENIAAFLNIRPKLNPSFVWSVMRFDNAVKDGERTFYRSGNNGAWTADERWLEAMRSMQDISFERFGYSSGVDYVCSVAVGR